ncbi:hypothetical protein [Cohnella cellulosilytica]|uniref:DUF5050 domain-containing protein n=1 Tax=Cohnella cellulosilytica TaxID=986710 RepID=A0ABW2F4X9_9BACL
MKQLKKYAWLTTIFILVIVVSIMLTYGQEREANPEHEGLSESLQSRTTSIVDGVDPTNNIETPEPQQGNMLGTLPINIGHYTSTFVRQGNELYYLVPRDYVRKDTIGDSMIENNNYAVLGGSSPSKAYINVVGDWVYYVGLDKIKSKITSDCCDNYFKYDLLRASTDGSKVETVVEELYSNVFNGEYNSNAAKYPFIVIGDSVYYTRQEPKSEELSAKLFTGHYYSVQKFNLSSRENSFVTEGRIYGANEYQLLIEYADNMYLLYNLDDGQKLMGINDFINRLESTSQEGISRVGYLWMDSQRNHLFAEVNNDSDSGRYKEIVLIDIETGDTSNILTYQSSIGLRLGDEVRAHAISEDWIYYIDAELQGMFKKNIVTQEQVKLSDEYMIHKWESNSDLFEVPGDGWIYYSKDHQIYRLKDDGSIQEFIDGNVFGYIDF